MTADPRIERALPAILADLGSGETPDYELDVLAAVTRIRQRPAWTFPARWLRVDPIRPAMAPARLQPVLVILLLLALIVAAVTAWVGSRPRVPAPFGLAGNGQLAFGLGGDIYVGGLDHAPTPIVTGDPNDVQPFFSPDGTRLAFFRRSSGANGGVDIMVADADGSHPQAINPRPLTELPWFERWTPDSRQIAVVTNPRADGVLELFDASKPADPRVVDPGMLVDGIAFQPPDGRRILFRGRTGDEIGLYLMDPDGTHLTTLVEPFRSDLVEEFSSWYWQNEAIQIAELRNPAFSPDGRQVVFQRYADQTSTELVLYMVPSDGSAAPRAITHGAPGSFDAYPAFSPDGTRIAYLHGDHATGLWRFAVLRLADGRVTFTGPPVDSGMAALIWSPDGSTLLGVQHRGGQAVVVLDPDGGDGRVSPWAVESADFWLSEYLPNGIDAGSWQRVAGP